MNLPTNQHDEVPPDELTPREAMREILIIARDVLVGLLAIIVGATIHASLHGPQWLVPLSMVPFALWLWWRGKVPREVWPILIFLFFAFPLFYIVTDRPWFKQPRWGWPRVTKILIMLVLMWTAQFFARAWKTWMQRQSKAD